MTDPNQRPLLVAERFLVDMPRSTGLTNWADRLRDEREAAESRGDEDPRATAINIVGAEILNCMGPEHRNPAKCLHCEEACGGIRVPFLCAERQDLWVHQKCHADWEQSRLRDAACLIRMCGGLK